MLYHFATREELVEAAVQHIELARARVRRDLAVARAGFGLASMDLN